VGHVEDRWYAIRDGRKTRTGRHGRGQRYRVRYRVDGRERSGGSYDRKLDADRRLAQLQADVLRGTWVDPSDRTVLADYARRYVTLRPYRATTARRMTGMVERHIAATALGRRRVAAIRPSEVQAWAADRSRVLSPGSMRLLLGMLRSVFRAAVLDKLVASSPVVNVSVPRGDPERVVPLTPGQVQQLAAAMPLRYRAMVVVQAGLGLRIGELLSLRASDVDFLRRVVRIDEQIPPGSRTRTELKTPRSRRTLPLPTFVSEALAQHMRAYPPAADGTLFTTTAGRPLTHVHYGTSTFRKAVERAGLPAGTTSHDLRHAYASWLLAAGESVVCVAERLGHCNGQLVLTTYGHLLPDSEDRTRSAVDSAWNPAPAEAATAPGRPR
jgi:integrase